MTTATKAFLVPARKVDQYEVTVMDMQGWKKVEVEAALEATGMDFMRASRFTQLWEVVKPKHLLEHAENDNEARGILAHALFLQPHCQDHRGEVRYLFDRASRYMEKRIEVGTNISKHVFQVWHALRWMLVEWQAKQAR